MPLSGEKNDVSSFSQSHLIGSLSNLQVTRTGIKARTSSNLCRIRSFTLELFAFERGFFPYRLKMTKRQNNGFFRNYDLKLATDNRSDKVLTSKLCPLGGGGGGAV